MSVLLNIYNKSPANIQNILTSVRGLYLKKIRYNKHTWETYNFLNESQYWSLDKLEEYQLNKLKNLIKHSIEFSPYYKNLYNRLDIKVSNIKALSDIDSLPIISKEDFRNNNLSIVSTHENSSKMWVSYTSGTTGTPLRAYHTHREVQETMAFLERLYSWYNPTKFRSRASFTGKLMVSPEKQCGPFHRKNLAINQWLFSSHHLSEKNLNIYLNELAKLNPAQIDGIASSIFVIADHIIRTNKIGLINPSVVIPTSETLWPHIRARIEKAFNCKVANQYGSQEGAPIAYECIEGGFHTCPESGIFEIIRPDGTKCENNETGRLVVTSFLSSGTPLIRYDIGDLASWDQSKCKCGRKLPKLKNIEGRMDDMFFTKERGIVPRVDSAFKEMPNAIKASQVAQITLNSFELRIIPDEKTYKDKYANFLVNNLHDYLGRSVKIKIKILKEINRTKGGKLRAMVNESQAVKGEIINSWNELNN